MTGADYDDLVAAATVGLSRRPLRLTGLTGAVAAHAPLLDPGDQPRALLDAAALMVTARRAGVLPATGLSGPAPAPPDRLPELPARAAAVLERAFGHGYPVVVGLLDAAAGAGYRAPAPLLPALLDMAVKHPDLRPAVTAVLGARGQWLAAQRPEWRAMSGAPGAAAPGAGAPDGAAPEADGIWETGRRGERRAYLAARRGRDPAAARDLLAAGWSRETGDDRADLLAVLAHGLSAADEEFLEAALDDRKGPVRDTARELLARLPGSAFTRRAAARAQPLLRLETRPGRAEWLVASPPEAADVAAVRDGIVAQAPPADGIGLWAWLLTQMIAAVPLAGWETRFGRDAAHLASLPVAGNLGPDVHAGWRLAALRQASQPWAQALLESSAPMPVRNRPYPAWASDDLLAALLPAGARAARAAAQLASGAPGTAVTAAVAAAQASQCPGPWPDVLADAVLAALSGAAASGVRDYWSAGLADAAGRLMPVTGVPGGPDYAEALVALSESGPCVPSLRGALYQAAEVFTLRRAFARELRLPHPPAVSTPLPANSANRIHPPFPLRRIHPRHREEIP